MTHISEEDFYIYQRYNLRIKETHIRSPVMKLPMSCVIDMTATEAMQMTRFYSEKVYAIEITETYLDRLTNDLKHFHEYIRDPSEYREMRDRELNVRKRNPAVQKAWANYKMLLKLAAEGRTLDHD